MGRESVDSELRRAGWGVVGGGGVVVVEDGGERRWTMRKLGRERYHARLANAGCPLMAFSSHASLPHSHMPAADDATRLVQAVVIRGSCYQTHTQSNGTGRIPGPANLPASAAAAANTDGTGIPQQSPHPTSRCPAPPKSPCGCACAWPRCASSASASALTAMTGPSYARREPKRKCCITGSLPSTSARYILTMPALTLSHVLTCRSARGSANAVRAGRNERGRGRARRRCRRAWASASAATRSSPVARDERSANVK